jgi:hypothetical protein
MPAKNKQKLQINMYLFRWCVRIQFHFSLPPIRQRIIDPKRIILSIDFQTVNCSQIAFCVQFSVAFVHQPPTEISIQIACHMVSTKLNCVATRTSTNFHEMLTESLLFWHDPLFRCNMQKLIISINSTVRNSLHWRIENASNKKLFAISHGAFLPENFHCFKLKSVLLRCKLNDFISSNFGWVAFTSIYLLDVSRGVEVKWDLWVVGGVMSMEGFEVFQILWVV